MPTPVSAARQCLTDEAARVLDDAVGVARRRSHAQTTSLHAVSALLALPSSALRDACGRARTSSSSFFSSSSTSSPRMQFRALGLSVGVSLDRLPSSKGGAEEEPPVSNSLMAAIRRSQANQRRHPDSFHLFQQIQHNQNQNQQVNGTTSFLKVELKHFVLSILDDPIVSRVFAEAGFRSCDVKVALLQPPLPQAQPSSRFFSSRTRSPPVFLCNLEPGGPGFNLGVEENSRRIAEVITRKSKRNPLLMGVYAKGALRSFTELLQKCRGGAFLFPPEMAGLSLVSLEKEIAEFVGHGGSEENMGLRFQELGREVEQCSGPGVAVSFGQVEVFVGDAVNADAVRFVVSRLTRLLEIHGGKVWLVGVAETSDAYSKFLVLFPNVENDWDLHLLTVTSATPSLEGLYSKSSLMGSFVPFGGFFPTPSEIKNPASCANATFTRCGKCNEKYEQEVADIQKNNEENTSLNDKILGFQKKWSDICQRLHHARSLPEFDISQTRFQAPPLEVLRFGSGFKESSSKDPSRYELQYSSQISCMPKELPGIFPLKQVSPVPVPSDTISVNTGTDYVPQVSKSQQIELQTPWVAPSTMANMSVLDQRSSSSLTPVTTDLGLGTLYTSAAQEPDTPNLRDQKKHLQHLSDSVSNDCDTMNENTSPQIARSSWSGPYLGNFDSVDFKALNQLLSEKVSWQDEAICAINQTLYLCRSGAGKRRGSHVRADIWFAFLGPDRLGKKKIASALAEIIFGNKDSLISVDLSSQDRSYPLNSIFECQKSYCYDVLRRKTVVDYIAGELSKKPHSVIFLENVDKADFLVQTSLLQAIRTGKFPDSHGREISTNNAIFLATSTVCKGNGSFVSEESKMFSEERILEAKRYQMQIVLGHTSEDAKRWGSTNVKVVPRKLFSKPSILNKRKQADSSDSKEGATTFKMQKQFREASRSYLDLNIPVEEGEEGINDNEHESESLVENSDAWLNDFCNQVDEKVVFKPFNFDVLAEQVLKSVSIQFQRTFGSEFQLEIDYEVMVQILAAAWLSDKKNAVEDWVKRVLGRGFVEALQKYHISAQYVVKLVNCESIFVEEQAPGVCLPARINLN
ncbi:protein SMAX1-LIKE 6-like isoform X2 [Gastrolobium bilobum]|uniref:protein SMAX1-LIKE 6-like isoform X2 n=1 Tax=Gastrolobium bilobum TaxID=150636 RepID=UPI002AB12019|nr:protein SMAX1-LIKE 6-like isoform X2 [Gastrolobium bilobum]